MEISKSITKRVRGLHRAIKMHKRDGHYYDWQTTVPLAVEAAKRGDYKKAYMHLYVSRRNKFIDIDKPVVTSHVQMVGRVKRPELIKCELSKKFLAAVKAPAIPTEHMWMHDQLEIMLETANVLWHSEYTNETRHAILKAGRNKLMAALA